MKSLTGVLLVFGVVGMLTYTNPTMDDYVDFIKNELIRRSQNSVDQGLLHLLGGFVISGATERRNYVLFSIYQTQDPFKITDCLAILGNFYGCNIQNTNPESARTDSEGVQQK